MANFTCLSMTEGLCGLGNWIQHKPNAVGNLAERDYGVDDVKAEMEVIAKKWPKVELTIHCGDEYEDSKCIATLILKDGVVQECNPQVDTLPDMSQEMIEGRMRYAIYGRTIERELARCKACHSSKEDTVEMKIGDMTVNVSTNHQVAETIREYKEEGIKFKVQMCSECGTITEVRK